MAGIWHSARKFFTRRPTRPRRNGPPPGRRRRLRLHYRWPARAALRGQAWPGYASQKNRLPRPRLPHRRKPRQNFRENLGPLPPARAVRPRGHPLRPTHLRPARRQRRRPRIQTRRNATPTRTRPRHRRELVFSQRFRPPKTPRRIFNLRDLLVGEGLAPPGFPSRKAQKPFAYCASNPPRLTPSRSARRVLLIRTSLLRFLSIPQFPFPARSPNFTGTSIFFPPR
jgi:hypothetical protein